MQNCRRHESAFAAATLSKELASTSGGSGPRLRPTPQGLIQLPRPQQDIPQAAADVLRVERLLTHDAMSIKGIHDRIENGAGQVG